MPAETQSTWSNLLLAASKIYKVNLDLYYEWIQTIV